MENGTEKAYHKRNFKYSSPVHPIVPLDEIRWLQEELNDGKKYIVFSHHSFVNEFMKRGVSNKTTVQKLFRKKTVLLCLNGHDHGDSFTCVDDIFYMTVNSANYAWLGAQIASSKTLIAQELF